MGWFFVNICIPICAPVAFLFLMKLIPAPAEYKQKAEVLRAVRDGQLGWVVVGIGSGLLYEAFTLDRPNGTVITVAIVLILVSAVLSAFGLMFPFRDEDSPAPSAKFWEKAKVYQVLSATVFCLVVVSALYTVHHFFLVATSDASQAVVVKRP